MLLPPAETSLVLEAVRSVKIEVNAQLAYQNRLKIQVSREVAVHLGERERCTSKTTSHKNIMREKTYFTLQ